MTRRADALLLLSELRDQGVKVYALGGSVFVEPRTAMTRRLSDRVRALRSSLVAILDESSGDAAVAAVLLGGQLLRERGWSQCTDGVRWTHPDLAFPWPQAQALRLELEQNEPLSARAWP